MASNTTDAVFVGAYYERMEAFRLLGEDVSDAMSVEQAMDAAHLRSWNVRKAALTAHDITEDGVTDLEIPDRWATVRTDPRTGASQYFGVVGSHYTPIQNEEHVDLLETLVDESGARLNAAGTTHGGRQTFLSMRLPDTIQVGGADAVDLHLIALNSHDGSSAFRFLVSPLRLRCTNQLRAAVKGAKASFSVRHTGKAGAELQEAREALGLTWKYIEGFQEAAEKLIARTTTARWVDDFLFRVFEVDPADESKATERARAKVADVQALWRESDTIDDGFRSTRWGAYQSVTEYLDHFAPAQGTDLRAARAYRSVTSHATNRLKERAFALASA